MNKQRVREQIQCELAEYGTLTNDEEKAIFWARIRVLDAQLTKEDHSLINQVIYDNLQDITANTRNLLLRAELAKTKL